MEEDCRCVYCGASLATNFKFCPFCGKPTFARNACPQCGTEQSPMACFCTHCGTALGKPESDQPVTAEIMTLPSDIPVPSEGVTIEFPMSGAHAEECLVDY